MKLDLKKIILIIVFFATLGVANLFANYFKNNPMYVSVFFSRIMGDRYFYINGIKMKTPNSCKIHNSADANLEIVGFFCAINPKTFEGVSVRRSSVVDIYSAKPYTEKYIEHEDYIHMVIGPKQGTNEFDVFYLKHQNVVVMSDSKELAAQFVDELLQHNFHIESSLPSGDDSKSIK